MRNNFNTSAFSELVYEIHDDPAEAWFSFTGRAEYSPRRGVSACIGPAMIGTLKSARKFQFRVNDPLDDPSSWIDPAGPVPLTPLALALTGLAACSLKTLVGGGSARGVVFESAEMLAEVRPAIASDGLAASTHVVDCQFRIDAAVPDELVEELLQQVQEFSPNHRTVTDKMPVSVRYGGNWELARGERVWAGSEACAESSHEKRHVQWVTGPQFESRHPGNKQSLVHVDSPKQLTGADWGPNAQEFLLMGLAADIVCWLNHLTEKEFGLGIPWSVSAAGRIDAGGLLDTGESLVGVQDMVCAVGCRGSGFALSEAKLRRLICSAVSSSTVYALLSSPQKVDVSLMSFDASGETRRIGRRAS